MTIEKLGSKFAAAVAMAALMVPLWSSSAGAAAPFNVKSYGAVGDGTTDDTVAIKKAIAAAEAQPGSTVLFPAGNYLYSLNLQAQSITLQGQGNATLTSANNFADVELLGRNVNVIQLTFASQGSAKAHPAIHVLPFTNGFQISRCTFNAEFGQTISVQHASNGQIFSNVITTSPTVDSSGIHIFEESSSCVVENNLINGNDPSQAGKHHGLLIQDSRGIGVTRNTIAGLFVGIASGGNSSMNVNNNSITACTQGVHGQLDNGSNVVTNRINLAGLPDSVGVLQQASKNVLIKDNSMIDLNTGVSMFGSSVMDLDHNIINGAAVFGVFSDSTEQMQIQNNDIDRVGRGGIVVIGTENTQLNRNQITGSKGFGISVTGQKVTINGNMLKDVAPSQPGTHAVVFLLSAGSGNSITNNSYTGTTTNLSYFIHCVQPSPPVVITGNKTNTMLPNLIGS